MASWPRLNSTAVTNAPRQTSRQASRTFGSHLNSIANSRLKTISVSGEVKAMQPQRVLGKQRRVMDQRVDSGTGDQRDEQHESKGQNQHESGQPGAHQLPSTA